MKDNTYGGRGCGKIAGLIKTDCAHDIPNMLQGAMLADIAQRDELITHVLEQVGATLYKVTIEENRYSGNERILIDGESIGQIGKAVVAYNGSEPKKHYAFMPTEHFFKLRK